jgi:regulator of replication initiation timing
VDGNEKEIFERLTALESSYKSLHKRLDHIEQLVESVQKMTVEMQHMREDLNEITENIENIKSKPAKLWETLITAALSACSGGIVTFIATKIIGG